LGALVGVVATDPGAGARVVRGGHRRGFSVTGFLVRGARRFVVRVACGGTAAKSHGQTGPCSTVSLALGCFTPGLRHGAVFGEAPAVAGSRARAGQAVMAALRRSHTRSTAGRTRGTSVSP
jgi:hypothetical protein